MAEVDFPRGIPTVSANGKKNSIAKNNIGKGGKKVNAEKPKSTKEAKPKRLATIISADNQNFTLTPEAFHKDVLLLGYVSEVRQDETIVELPNNNKGVLRDSTILNVGQVVTVAVTGVEGTLFLVTVSPTVLNQSLTQETLREGLFISGVISSVEDRGYSVETAIEGTHSFIAKTNAKFTVGQYVFCVLSKIDSGRLFLTPQSDEDATYKEISNWKSVSLPQVRPGNSLKAQVLQRFTNGLSVRIYNQPSTSPLTAFIPSSQLQQPLDHYSAGFRMNGRITFVDYRTQRVIITALPHIVNYQSTTPLFTSFKHLRGLVFSVTPSPRCILPTVPPKQAVFLDTISTEDKEPVDVKVVGVSYFQAALVVSSDVAVVENEGATLEISDLHPGMLVNGEVTEISKTGIEVKLAPSISNVKCSTMHLSDAPSLLRIDSFYTLQQQIQCRVLSIDDETVHITNKPTLVNSSLRVISSYHHALPGCVAHGWVSKVTKSEVTVSFYNNITGTVPGSEIEGSPLDSYHVGEVIVCQVVECKDVKDKSELVLTVDIQLARPVPDQASITKARQAFTAATVGQKVSGVVSHTDSNGLTLILESGISAILPTQHLSDHHSICESLLTRYYVGTQISNLLVLNKDTSNMRLVLSNKASLHKLPTTYENIKVGDILPGHVKQISDTTYTIGFLGTWKATIPKADSTNFVLGQSVSTLVTEVMGNGLLGVSVTDKATKTNGLTLLNEYFKGVDGIWGRSKLAKSFHVGTVVSGAVDYRYGQPILHLDHNVIGLVDETTDSISSTTAKGVVVDVDYANALVHVNLTSNLVQNITDTTSVPADKQMRATVLLITRAYLVASVMVTPQARAIVYVPRGDYNTQGLGTEHFTNVLPGNSVLVQKADNHGVSEEGSKGRAIFVLVDSLPNSRREVEDEEVEVEDEVMEDAGDENGTESKPLKSKAKKVPEAAAGSIFAFADDGSDSEEDPDMDSLAEYMKRSEYAQSKREAADAKRAKKAQPKPTPKQPKQASKSEDSDDDGPKKRKTPQSKDKTPPNKRKAVAPKFASKFKKIKK